MRLLTSEAEGGATHGLDLTRCGTSTPRSSAWLDGTRAYLHAVIDNFSRRILAWRVADTFAPVTSVAVLEASRGATRTASAPVVLADAGVENVERHQPVDGRDAVERMEKEPLMFEGTPAGFDHRSTPKPTH
jgi:transposase InsO family protein